MTGMIVDPISVQRLPDYGYELRTEWWRAYEDDTPVKMVSAYSLGGHYIGTAGDAYFLCRTRGIRPEIIKVGHNTCTIGFNEKEQKWYGWSHRAICGFGIGDVVEEGDCTSSSGMTDECVQEFPELDFRSPVGFRAITLEDAKKMAIAFADSVS
ncbi:MAG: hypothetical protein HF975_04400 [ANME-2 cluster archaeon]|nr:hypothetical protein [ANME-2 cluster archaeon]